MSGHTKRDKEKAQPIQVFVRIRPPSKQERDNRSCSCVEILNSRELSIKQQHSKRYAFDGVFGQQSKQLSVYETIVQPLIAEILAGYNCTVFAYGQTGTGKTYTMAGGSACTTDVSWQDDEQAGIIPRALAHLFDELRLIQQEYTVRVSYLELYNEELYDLLADGDDINRMRIYEDQRQKGSVIIQGIEEQTVHSKYEVYRILEKGQERRRTASTLMNDQSSRSHTVFSITIHTRETTVEGEELVKTGKLNLVDLAGSENISRSGAVDRRAREAGNINQSLLNLGRVIKALVEKSAHIPYRASKLTRILQDSLGGRTKTSIIATISPAASSLDETLSTLDYANRARNITNRPEVNQKMSQKALMSQYVDEIERLRKDLSATRTGNGIYLANDNYNRLIADQQMCTEELAEKVTLIRDLEQQLKGVEEQKDIVEEQWNKLQQSFEETNDELARCRDMLKQTTVEKEEQEHLASCYEKNAQVLHEQAQVLLNLTKSSTYNESVLREKIEKLYASAIANNDTMEKIGKVLGNLCSLMDQEMKDYMQRYYESNNRLADAVKMLQNNATVNYETSISLTKTVDEQIKNTVNECNSIVERNQSNTESRIREMLPYTHAYEKVVEDVQQWGSNQLVKNIKELLETEKIQHAKFCSKIEEHLQQVSLNFFVVSQDVSTNLNNLQQHLAKQHNTLSNDLCTQANSTDNALEQMTKWRQDMQKMMDDGFKMMQEKLTQARDTNLNSVAQIEGLTSTMESQFKLADVRIQKSIEQTIEPHKGIRHYVENSRKERDMLTFGTEKLTALTDEVSKKEQCTKDELKKLLERVTSFSDTFVHNNIEDLTKLQSTLETKLKTVVTINSEHKASITKSCSEFTEKSDDVLKQLTLSNEIGSHHESSIDCKLSCCQENLIKHNVIEIRHAGDTPARTQYNYPSTLHEPSPKDRILSRFRLHKPSNTEQSQRQPSRLELITAALRRTASQPPQEPEVAPPELKVAPQQPEVAPQELEVVPHQPEVVPHQPKKPKGRGSCHWSSDSS